MFRLGFTASMGSRLLGEATQPDGRFQDLHPVHCRASMERGSALFHRQ